MFNWSMNNKIFEFNYVTFKYLNLDLNLILNFIGLDIISNSKISRFKILIVDLFKLPKQDILILLILLLKSLSE